MSHLIVFRIETPTGVGPYISADACIWADFPHALNIASPERPSIRPTWSGHSETFDPPIDYEAGEYKDFICGFHHKRLAHKWFGCVRHILHEYGYTLAVYRVHREHVRVGKRQCLFMREHAELIERRALAV